MIDLGVTFNDNELGAYDLILPKIEFLGVTLFGALDCLVHMPNGEVGIFDAKTGARKSFDKTTSI